MSRLKNKAPTSQITASGCGEISSKRLFALFSFMSFLSVLSSFQNMSCVNNPTVEVIDDQPSLASSSASLVNDVVNVNSDIDEELKTFLDAHPNTPGAKFIELWHFNYRGNTASEEIERQGGCKGNGRVNAKLCLAGTKGYNANKAAENHIGLPLWEDQPETINTHTITHADSVNSGTVGDKRIVSLGTFPSCIPLLLAGYSARLTRPDDGIVVELGPFAGFSSRCIVSGMRAANRDSHRDNDNSKLSYVAFDTFEGHANYKAISRGAPWTTRDPDHVYDKNHTDFLWVWEAAVKDIYPSAEGRKGYASKTTVNYHTLGNKTASMISVDSAKSVTQFIKQQEGLLPVRAGTIWFFMDFTSVQDQPRWVYGCMREEYLIPVFASGEQWAFVVKKDIVSLNGPVLSKCFQNIASNLPQSLDPLQQQLENDFNSDLLGFRRDGILPNQLPWFNNVLVGGVSRKLNETNPKRWEKIARESE